jgi:hypothetical protein
VGLVSQSSRFSLTGVPFLFDSRRLNFAGWAPSLFKAALCAQVRASGVRAVIGQLDATQHVIDNVRVPLDVDSATDRDHRTQGESV